MDRCRRLSSLVLILSFLITAACTRTTIGDAWKKSDYSGKPFTSLLVVAVIDDPNRKLFWENTVADRLRESGVKTVATSINSFPNDRGLQATDIIAYAQKQKVDGVLVTRLLDIQEKKAPAPAQGPVYASGGQLTYYNNFTTFYPQAYDIAQGTRATATLTTVQLETNLYSTETLELVWSMVSDTLEPRTVEKLAASVSGKMIATLKRDGLL